MKDRSHDNDLFDHRPINLINTYNQSISAMERQGTNRNEFAIITDILEQINIKENWKTFPKRKLSVWITSFFPKQVDLLTQLNVDDYHNLKIEISTIRKFTGDEADVVIWSITRAPYQILKKKRSNFKFRINLGPVKRPEYIYDLFTRIKSKMIIVGVKKIYEKIWENLIQNRAKNEDKIKLGLFLKSIQEEEAIFTEFQK